MAEEITYWDCDPDCGQLQHGDLYGAIEYGLDEMWFENLGDPGCADSLLSYIPEELTVYGFKRIKVTPEMCREPLNDILEGLDEEYGNPEGDYTKPTDAMKKAQEVFLKVVAEEYSSWACAEVVEKTINAHEWIKKNRPDWLAGKG